MNKFGIEKGIIKVIDGEMYYKSHYCYWLYTQLEEMQTRIDKAIEYFTRRDIEWGSYEQKVLLDILRGEDNELIERNKRNIERQ